MKISGNKFRIVEQFSEAYGTDYTVNELYINWRGKETWIEWIHDCGVREGTVMTSNRFSSIEKAEAEIIRKQKAKGFIPKVVKELEYGNQTG